MKPEGLFLAGLGSCLPERVSTDRAVELGLLDAEVREATQILSATVAGERPAPDMAIEAARQAIERSGHEAADFAAVFHSNVYFQGPDGWSAHHYILRHTIDRPVTAVEIRQGCGGMFVSLELALSYLSADQDRTAVLLTAADNFNSPLLDRWRTSKLFVLGDGGAAVVVSKRGGFARILGTGFVSIPAMEELHRGGEVLFPPGITVGQPMDLEARVQYWREAWAKGIAPPMGSLGDTAAQAVKIALAAAGLEMSDIAKVSHVSFGWPGVEQWFLTPIGVDQSRSTWEFGRTTGHVGACDAFLGLDHLIRTGQVGPGSNVLLLGAAPGMECGAVVLQLTDEAVES
jgi:3-oxoacyl-[acyl-carrier-protein] synthase III